MGTARQQTILLVEDEAIVAMAGKSQLGKEGYQVVHAATGEQAIALVAADNVAFDLVLMDIDLGRGIDGTQAAEAILKMKDVPIVFLSSHTEKAIVEKTEKITSYGYVVKASSFTVLDASIKMALRLFDAKSALARKDAALQDQEERYRLLYEQAGIAVGYYAPDGTVISYNDLALRNMQARAEDVVGKSVFDLFPEPDSDTYMQRIRQTLASDVNIEYEDHVELPRGGNWFSSTFSKVSDEHGNAIGVQIQSKNITERKQAEDEVHRREALLNKIFDVLPVGLWLADKNGTLTRSNARGREIWGAEPLVGQEQYGRFKARALPSGKEIAPADWALAHTIRDGTTVLGEMLEIDAFDGRKKVILNYTAPILDASGNVDGAVIVNLDITKRRQIEDELKEANEELAAANEELAAANEQFAASDEELIAYSEQITESKKRLAESEARFKALHNASFGGIAVHDQGIILDCNQGLADMSGYSLAELTAGMDGLLLIAEGSRDDVRRRIKAGYEEPYEAVGVRKNGDEYPVRLEARNIPYHGKRVRTVEFRDITAEKRAEEALRVSEVKYRTLFDVLPLGVTVTDDTGGTMECNNRAEALIGLSREAQLGRKIDSDQWRIIRSDGSPMPPAEYAGTRALKENRLIENIEMGIVAADETVTWLNVTATPVPLPGYGVVISFSDITERKRIEIESAEKQGFIESILGGIGDAFFSLDTNLVVQYFNAAAERMLKRNACDVIGRYLFDAFPEARGSIFDETYHRAVAEKVQIAFETYFDTPPYRDWYDVNVYQLRDGIAVLFHVTTERKQSEERVKNLLSEKELVLKEVHHRIKNNMNTIYSLLRLQAEAQVDTTARHALMDAAGRVRSMWQLYEKLYESGDDDSVSMREYLPGLIDEIVGVFPEAATVDVHTEIDDIVLETKVLTPLGIIMNELITNSMKYAFAGRTDGRISVHAANDAGRVVVQYHDNGPGIPESVTCVDSTGFGMQLVGLMVEQLGGSVWIDRGQGAQITIEIPG